MCFRPPNLEHEDIECPICHKFNDWDAEVCANCGATWTDPAESPSSGAPQPPTAPPGVPPRPSVPPKAPPPKAPPPAVKVPPSKPGTK